MSTLLYALIAYITLFVIIPVILLVILTGLFVWLMRR